MRSSVQREDDERLDELGYDDIGGCKKQLSMIRELVSECRSLAYDSSHTQD